MWEPIRIWWGVVSGLWVIAMPFVLGYAVYKIAAFSGRHGVASGGEIRGDDEI